MAYVYTNEKLKKLDEPKNLVVDSFYTKKPFAGLREKQKLALVKTAKEVYLLLAGNSQSSP